MECPERLHQEEEEEDDAVELRVLPESVKLLVSLGWVVPWPQVENVGEHEEREVGEEEHDDVEPVQRVGILPELVVDEDDDGAVEQLA